MNQSRTTLAQATPTNLLSKLVQRPSFQYLLSSHFYPNKWFHCCHMSLFTLYASAITPKFKIVMEESESLEETLRKHSLERITIYEHPEIVLKHEPINARECEELQAELREKTREKVDLVRREGINQDVHYDQVYGEFIKMTITNEAQQAAVCRDLKEMHEIADILMNPPAFGKDLYLSSKQPPSPAEAEELTQIFAHYQRLYLSGHTPQQNEAEDAIRRAKAWVLQRPNQSSTS